MNSSIARFVVAVCAVIYWGAALAQSPPQPPVIIAIDDGTVNPVPPTSGWQLPQGHFVNAKMQMTLVHPRPDSETNVWARHRRAYPGLEYRIPISVQGGAYPFYFELVGGPQGMTIGKQYGLPNYGILTWTPGGTGGPYQVKVRITDQESKSVEAIFTVVATTNGFVFVDSVRGSPANSGTIDSPKRDLVDIHGDGVSDRGFGGYIAYLRGGTYNSKAAAPTSSYTGPKVTLRSSSTPMTVLGYPGEEATIDFSRGRIDVGSDDSFVSNVHLTNTPYLYATEVRFLTVLASSRVTVFDVKMSFNRRNAVENDNSGGIHFTHADQRRRYITVWGIDAWNYETTPIGSFYASEFVVIENNRIGATSFTPTYSGIHLKRANDYVSIRRNRIMENSWTEGALRNMLADNYGQGPQRTEYCYNVLRSTDLSSSRPALTWEIRGNATGDNYAWIYRNTIVGHVTSASNLPESPSDARLRAVFEKNLWFGSSTPQYQGNDTKRIITSNDDIRGDQSALGQMLDANLALKGDARASYLGTHGHEIAP